MKTRNCFFITFSFLFLLWFNILVSAILEGKCCKILSAESLCSCKDGNTELQDHILLYFYQDTLNELLTPLLNLFSGQRRILYLLASKDPQINLFVAKFASLACRICALWTVKWIKTDYRPFYYVCYSVLCIICYIFLYKVCSLWSVKKKVFF